MLRRRPGFTLAAVLTLALGIGANTAIFSVVNAAVLRPLPFRDPDRLLWITSVNPDHKDDPFSLPEFLDYQWRTQALESLEGYGTFAASITGTGDAERVQGMRASGGLFTMLGVEAAAGRLLVPEDDIPGHSRVVVISHGFWVRRFGGDPKVIGKPLILNSASYTILGVMPKDFTLPARNSDVVVPLAPQEDPLRTRRASTAFMRVIGRLKPGVRESAATGELNAINADLRRQFPVEYAKRTGVQVLGLQRGVAANYSTSLWVTLAAVALVLFIACANLANLLLARMSTRQKEIAIRRALGATSIGIVRLLLAESMTLAVAGGAAGILAAAWGLPLLLRGAPADLPRLAQVSIDGRVLAFTIAVSLFTGILFGLAPALQVSRRRGLQAINDGGKGAVEGSGAGSSQGRFRGILVSAEVALALMLLTCGGLFVKSFLRLQAVTPGFEPSNVLVTRMSLPKPRYATADALAGFYERLLPKVQSLPGVRSVGAINVLPMSPVIATVDFTVVGKPPLAGHEIPESQYRMASPGYFSTMRIPVRRGREFLESDNAKAASVAAINETLAKKFFPGGDAIGAQLMVSDNPGGPRKVEIVPIVGDVKQTNLESNPTFDVYLPIRQVPPAAAFWLANNEFWVVRTTGNPMALAEAFRREARAIDADVATSNIRAMDDYMESSVAQRRFTMSLVGVFAFAGLLLAAGGIYAVVSYTVSLRTQEIAIRMALGAQRHNILTMVLGDGMRFVLAGLAAGFVASLGAARLLHSMLYGVSAVDPQTFATIPLLLTAAALAACLAPALRAARVLPMTALRGE